MPSRGTAFLILAVLTVTAKGEAGEISSPYSWERIREGNPLRTSYCAGWYSPVSDSLHVYGGGSGEWRYDLSTLTWHEITSDPTPGPRSYMAYTSAPDIQKAFVFGGWKTGSIPASDLWEFDMLAGQWRQLPEGPSARIQMSLSALSGNTLLLFGGYTHLPEWIIYSDLWRFDTVLQQWAELYPSQSPTARNGHAAAACKGNLYVYGGRDLTNFFGDMWKYSPGINEWTDISSSPSPGPLHLSSLWAVEDLNALFLFGGVSTQSGQSTDQTWKYDVLTGQWMDVTPASGPTPSPRKGATAAWDSKRKRCLLYAGSNRDDVWAFDPYTLTWEELRPKGAPRLREWFAAIGVPGLHRLFVWGGLVNQADMSNVYQSDFWQFDLNIVRWINLPSGPPIREKPALAWEETTRRLYFFGGKDPNNQGSQTFWKYDPFAALWTELPASPRPLGRFHHTMIGYPERGTLLLFGGSKVGTALNDFWEYDPRGNTWTEFDDGSPPPVRYGASMTLCPERNSLLLFGGLNFGEGDVTVWEYSFVTGRWREHAYPGGPQDLRYYTVLFWDPFREALVALGGRDPSFGTVSELWEFRFTPPAGERTWKYYGWGDNFGTVAPGQLISTDDRTIVHYSGYEVFRSALPSPEPTPTETPGLRPPKVLIAGYWTTSLESHREGVVTILGLLDPGLPASTRVELGYEGVPLGVRLNDEGREGDAAPGDGLWTWSAPLSGSAPANHYLLEILTAHPGRALTTKWPYLIVE